MLGNEDQWPVSPRLARFPTEALAELAVVETTDETHHTAAKDQEEIQDLDTLKLVSLGVALVLSVIHVALGPLSRIFLENFLNPGREVVPICL